MEESEILELIIIKDGEIKYRCFIDTSKNIYKQLEEDRGITLCPGTCKSYTYSKAERI